MGDRLNSLRSMSTPRAEASRKEGKGEETLRAVASVKVVPRRMEGKRYVVLSPKYEKLKNK